MWVLIALIFFAVPKEALKNCHMFSKSARMRSTLKLEIAFFFKRLISFLCAVIVVGIWHMIAKLGRLQ